MADGQAADMEVSFDAPAASVTSLAIFGQL
jgi:hypothetical protein